MTVTDELALTTQGLEALRHAGAAKLDAQVLRAGIFQRYYDSEFDILAILDTDEREAFRKLLAVAGANWCELVINAVAERLQVVGFAFGDASDDAWAIWKANGLNADAELVQTDALVTGQGFVMVQPDDDNDNPTGVDISAESPFECSVIYQPGDRRERIAGYKRFSGLDPQAFPWPAWTMGEPAAGSTEVLITADVIATWAAGASDPIVMPNPSGVVGLIELVPQPRTAGPNRSELTSAIRIQDRINTTLFNRMVATDYGAFRQVWAAGVKMARQVYQVTDDQGQVVSTESMVKPFDVGANRLLVSENPNARFGSFPGDPLAGYLASVEQDVDQLAAITQTPTYYFRPIQNLAADAIKAAEAGLVAKVARRATHLGEGWEEVMRTALVMTGRARVNLAEGAVIWKDFETRSLAQLTDSLVKMRTLGVPIEALWALYGATPAQIEEWRAMRTAEESGPQLAPQPLPAPASGKSKAGAPTLPVTE